MALHGEKCPVSYIKLTTSGGISMINVSKICGIVQYDMPPEEALQPPYGLF